MSINILWIRHDLRLDDHPALVQASSENCAVIPLYIHAPNEGGRWALGEAAQSWLRHSLEKLLESFEQRGSRLILRRASDSVTTLCQVVAETRATAVYLTESYLPWERTSEHEIYELLEAQGIPVKKYPANTLVPQGSITTHSGSAYKVFTAFWKSLQGVLVQKPVAAPPRLVAPAKWPKSDSISDLGLVDTGNWTFQVEDHWSIGEDAAAKQFKSFLNQEVEQYPKARDIPSLDATSRLSPYLRYGEISVRRVWDIASQYDRVGVAEFMRQLAWREFAYQTLYDQPESPDKPLREAYADFPWAGSKEHLTRWQQGKTGYPIVDAAMRQLWHTGWMHNRLRMIVGSFLVKDLLISWQEGALWFWHTLVDGDLANNAFGWQWVAGSGYDASPFFRIFNPVLQGKKFDGEGLFVRKWVPELADVPDRWIHAPWQMPKDVRQQCGDPVGNTYPEPMIDHKIQRQKALDAFQTLKSN